MNTFLRSLALSEIAKKLKVNYSFFDIEKNIFQETNIADTETGYYLKHEHSVTLKKIGKIYFKSINNKNKILTEAFNALTFQNEVFIQNGLFSKEEITIIRKKKLNFTIKNTT